MKEIDVNAISTNELYKYLTSSITPRPIALVSSIDNDGNSNLSPFSFFNVFSIKPPILIFSPVNRVRDNTKKDTLNNISQ
jgi:flavin reductase (DIM6/NTAB) family NADH-FMN oxidoreductase RutF